MSLKCNYLLALYLQSNKLLLLCISGGRTNRRAGKLLLKCHTIMSNHGLYVKVSKIPCFYSIALLLSDKLVSLAIKIWLFLLLPTHNYPLPVGCWYLSNRRCESWHTLSIIISALAVVNNLAWVWLEKPELFSQVRCQYNQKTKMSMSLSSPS